MANEHTPHNRMSAADRQRQLLEVSMNAFSRRGFKGTTTKEIAATAGVTEAVIFQHFPSKEALYSAVLELHLDADVEGWQGMRPLLAQPVRDPCTVQRMHPVKVLGHQPGLVALNRTDAVPLNG